MDDERFQVHGTVTDEDGRELSYAEVIVWQQRLRERRRLAEGRTDQAGRYRISYRPPEDAPGRLLIVVTVRSSRLRMLLESPVTQAQPDLRVDLEAQPRDSSQHASLLRAISPLLEGLALVDVVESEEHRDISFLAQETGQSREEITRVVVAARLEAAFEIPAAAFYAFLRQQVPAALPSPLLEATQGFTLVDPLVHRVGSLIFALTPAVQTHTLQAAVAQGLIGTRYEQRIPELVQQLRARRTADVLSQPYLLGKGTLAQLLDAAELPKAKQPLLAEALVTNTQSMRKFWRTLGDGQHGFTQAEASAVQRSLEVGAFVKNHLPLVGRLLQGFREGTYATLADLARLSVQDWTQLVQEVGAPPNVDGAGPAGPAEVFAKVVYTRVTRAYPTAALAARVATAAFVPPVAREPVLRFFANNPALELGKTRITTYLEQAGEQAFAGIDAQHRPAVIDTARRFQRVLRVIADVDAAQTLLGLGVHSATQIATMGRQQFFAKATQAGLTKRAANRIYESGEQRYASVVSLLTQLNRGFIGTWPAAVGATADLDEPTANAIQRDQSLATLFGSVDYCAATDCTSVLSAAAYLCDLLPWLRNHPLTGRFPNALAALLDRRPDLRHLLLNCPNTEVPVPYIDLVNELLEDAVSPPATPLWKQTTRTAAELRAAPEHVNGAAYATLAAASYPHTLPYDTVLDELRTYLQQSGVALWQLRQALLPPHNPTLAQRLAVAAERFQLDPHERDLIANPDFVTPAVAWNTADPANDLVPVPAFLRAAAITYEQLLELLDVMWIRGSAAPLTLQGVDDTCDLSKQTLAPAPLDTGVLDRIHRILRLWRHAGWKLWELDLLLRAPATGNGVLDESTLVSLSLFRFLQDATGLAVDQQLAFFQDLDVRDHREPDGSTATSLYARLFLDPSVPADPDLAALLTGGAVADPTLAHHLAAVQGALQVSAAEAATLFALTDGTLTLANLSLLYRVTALARAARLSLADLLRVTPLTSAASLPAALADPAVALAFVEQLRAIRQSGFTVDALLYVLTTNPTATGITDDQITTVLAAVRAAIQQTHDEIFNSADPPLTVLQRELAQLPNLADPAVLATAIAIVNDSYTDTLANRNAFIAANFGEFMDVPTAQAKLGPLPGALTPAQLQAAIDQRAQDVLAPLAVHLTTTRVIAAVAAGVQLQPDVTALLVQQLLVPATSLTLLQVLTDPALIATPGGSSLPITPTNFPNHYLALRLLDKAGTVARRLHLVKADLSWLLANAAAYGGLDLGQLPVTNVQPALAIAPLLITSLLVKLDRAFAAAPPAAAIQDLYALISAVAGGALAAEADAQAALAAITGWAADDVASLAGALGLVFPADYRQPATYDALRRLQAMAEATGGSGAQLISWGAAAPDESAAVSAQAVLKSRYAESDWLQTAPTMTDPIRERRAAALQAYLLAQRTAGGDLVYGDANALFDHFLIDVQMSSCEVTTRVVQAYAAVQLFVERCLMGLEEPDVAVDLIQDDTWTQWQWMKRYRVWEAARKVFLYPENWLVESQRPNRTELFTKLEQEVHQSDSTADYLETVVLNYVDRLDELAHLVVTGTCTDPRTGAIHVVARTAADPPRFYTRSFVDNAWSGWEPIQLDIKAHQVVPALYRGRRCLFWPDIKVVPEPRQPLPAAQASSTPPPQETAKYVSIGLDFSVFRNGSWTPVQKSKGRLFDIPLLTSETVSDSRSVEALYTLKVQTPAPAPGYGASLSIDVFRLGDLIVVPLGDITEYISGADFTKAVHIGRGLFDGRFSDLELRNLLVPGQRVDDILYVVGLLDHAHNTYGPDAQPLLPLPNALADPDLMGEPGLIPQAGALATQPPNPSQGSNQTMPLSFTSVGALEQNVGPLLNTAAAPFRVVGPDADLAFDPTSYFFFQDTRRCYFVQSARYYQWGSAWLPVPPSNAGSAPFEVRYAFHRFYHPYTRLFWHQLAGGGFPALYDRNLQLNPDTIDPSGADVFSFSNTYQPVMPRVSWGEDNEIVAFEADAAFSVYHWELFFHVPLYIAERLSQNQQFEDALKWLQFIFNPNRQGPEPVPQRFWVPKPLAALTPAQILDERINELLKLVNQGDPDKVAQVRRWRKDPFNPFLLADQRHVAYMKRAVMSCLDILIAWADNLFSSDSREALNEATLLYVIAAEILGPQPISVTPPQHIDASFDDLEPKLDAFTNALVEIENVVGAGGGTGGGGGSGGGGNGSLPAPQTFYFKIPPNEKLLSYWTTIADRLFKLRHCQNIQGVTRELALFDAPIDPGLLVKAQAAGVDLGSVLSDTQAPLPSYRFTPLYAQALDFCAAVRGYGAQLLAAVEKRDAEALAVLLATQQRQLQEDLDQILGWRIDEAQKQIDALTQAHALAQQKYCDAHDHPWVNPAEATSLSIKGALIAGRTVVAIGYLISSGLHNIPYFGMGMAGFGGTPAMNVGTGGKPAGDSAEISAKAGEVLADALDKAGDLTKTVGEYVERANDNEEKAKEAQIEMKRIEAETEAANLRGWIAVQEQANHQAQADRLQQEIDFLTDKFSGHDLYDWMLGQLSDTYFQSYRLAYKLCKQVERCYRYELGLATSSFIQFGYWDSLKKGLLAGEALSHDLRRMQASYLERNSRRLELSRYVSLAALDPNALLTLLERGVCDFDLPESLFDGDYPGHYQRRLVRVSVTVIYPDPGRFDNVKGTLTLTKNSVRISTDLSSGYARPPGSDSRFVDQLGAVPQKIVLGNAQDDPGLFLTTLDDNLGDPRYLPFEGAGAISSWHLELPTETNEIDLSTVGDVVLHLHYTALDGGDAFKQAVEADTAEDAPNSGAILLSAANNFPAPQAGNGTQPPRSPWQSFLAPPPATGDQTLVLNVSPSRFPRWARGKTITLTGLTVFATSWTTGNFVLQPQAPLPTASIPLTPVAAVSQPNVALGNVAVANATPGTWRFKLRTAAATDFRSLSADDIGDLLLLVNFQVS
jgi:Tc toxin complex TcA C-terminal TcB-binding domain/Neuraminidase-like domain/Salmonella virulence plasmid 28.1kDa A protein